MISENERRGLIEIGSNATLTKVYWVANKILVVDLVIILVLPFFATPVVAPAFFTGISVGLLIFGVVSSCTVRPDKISRKEADIIDQRL